MRQIKILSLFNPFTLKRAWDNYDSEFCSYMFQQKEDGYYSYNYLDVIRLFSKPYFNNENKGLLRILIGGSISTADISGGEYIDEDGHNYYVGGGPTSGRVGGGSRADHPLLYTTGGTGYIFNDHELVSRLKSIDQNILRLLINFRCATGGGSSISCYPFRYTYSNKFSSELFNTQEQVNMLNNIDPDKLNFLCDKKVISNYSFAKLLKEETIDGINSINYDLLNALIDGVINKSLKHNEELGQLHNSLLYLDRLLNNKRNIEKFNSINPDFLNIVIDVSDYRGFSSRLHDINYFFDNITQEKLDRLCVNLDLLATLAKKNVIRSAQSIESVVADIDEHRYKGDIEKLSNHLDLLTLLIDKNIINSIQGGSDLRYFFYITRHNNGNIDSLYSLNLDVLTVLIDIGIIKDQKDLPTVCYLNEHDVENLNTLGSDLLATLISKGIVVYSIEQDDHYLKYTLLDKNKDLIVNMRNNLFLTRAILKMDELVEALGANGIKELISHPQYAESSNYLLKNCQLALVLYQKGAIENITVDYLFNSTQIQSDVTEFLKDVELADAGDNITLSMDNVIGSVFSVVNDNPIPRLVDLSLTAFAKALPSVGTRRT